MAIHKSVYGQFAWHLEPFADLDGYVPEPGDDPTDFAWPDGWSALAAAWNPELSLVDAWDSYVRAADSARVEAASALSQWRTDNV